MKIKTIRPNGLIAFYCPGCKTEHAIPLNTWQVANGPTERWTYNGDVNSPTLSPSVNVHAQDAATRCHSWVTDGKIQYLHDCHHELRGQTVELPDFE